MVFRPLLEALQSERIPTATWQLRFQTPVEFSTQPFKLAIVEKITLVSNVVKIADCEWSGSLNTFNHEAPPNRRCTRRQMHDGAAAGERRSLG